MFTLFYIIGMILAFFIINICFLETGSDFIGAGAGALIFAPAWPILLGAAILFGFLYAISIINCVIFNLIKRKFHYD